MSSKVSSNAMNGGEVIARDGDPAVRKANARKLAAGYTKKKRFCRYFVQADDANWTQLIWMPLCIIAAMTLSDLISGLAHWGLDSYGTPDTLIFGPFIRSFREHHVDQTAMCKHDFIETNADTTLPLLPLVLIQWIILHKTNTYNNHYTHNLYRGNIGHHVFLLTLFVFITITNEIHKWSHQVKQAPLVRKAMDAGVLLSPIAHRKHHKDPFDCSYCITTGWLNPPLDAINFWRIMEHVVFVLTGAVARANDQTLLGK